MGRKVIVCFLPANSSLLEDHWLNRAAARWAPESTSDPGAPPMVHTELFFPEHEPTSANTISGRSLGIHYGGKVFWAPKRFSKTQWTFRSLPCTEEAYQKMTSFARQQVGGAFNYMGYYTPCGISPSTRAVSAHATQNWYCSELVAHALGHGGMIDSAHVLGTHPQVLFDHINENTDAYHDTARNLATANIKI